MSNKVNEPTNLLPVDLPVPPMLSKVFGYKGKARYVAFYWSPYGDEAEYTDGRLSATGNWQAFLAYIQHPAASPFLDTYDLGSSDGEATHALILDLDKQEVLIAPMKEARIFLREQWPPEPPIQMSKEDQLAIISEALKNAKQPDHIDTEEIQRRIEEQFKLIEDMQKWLDRFLKN
jgi:hypothetical protein